MFFVDLILREVVGIKFGTFNIASKSNIRKITLPKNYKIFK